MGLFDDAPDTTGWVEWLNQELEMLIRGSTWEERHPEHDRERELD
jgi:hypothetical protein